jgi:hypothetical protein
MGQCLEIFYLNLYGEFKFQFVSQGNLKTYSEHKIHKFIGAWLSLEEHLLWEQGVGGSNPLAPTNRISVERIEECLCLGQKIMRPL